MDTRMDFQRLLEDMDRVIASKRLELSELDERLEAARKELGEREAKELARGSSESATGAANTNTNQEADRGGKSSNNNNNNLFSIPNQAQLDEHIGQLFEQKLEHFGAELNELDSVNQELIKENELLRRELLRSQANNDQLSGGKRQLELSLQELQASNLALSLRLSKAESELDMQEKLLKKSHQEDEVLMDALNDKLEALKRAIERRDDEIRRLRWDNQFVLEAFGLGGDKLVASLEESELNSISNSASNTNEDDDGIDSERKQRLLELVSAFKEKDSQIELLKGQLLLATKDLERNASLLENFSRSNQPIVGHDRGKSVEQFGGVKSSEQITSTSQPVDDNGELLLTKNRMLESELEAKDKQLSSLEFRLHHYETILPETITQLVQELLLVHQQSTGGGSAQFMASNNGSAKAAISESTLARLESIIDTLQRYLNGIDLSRGLLAQVAKQESLLAMKEAQVRQLVMELNELDAKFSLVQQQCDLLQANGRQPLVDREPARRVRWADDIQGRGLPVPAQRSVPVNGSARVDEVISGPMNEVDAMASECQARNTKATDSSEPLDEQSIKSQELAGKSQATNGKQSALMTGQELDTITQHLSHCNQVDPTASEKREEFSRVANHYDEQDRSIKRVARLRNHDLEPVHKLGEGQPTKPSIAASGIGQAFNLQKRLRQLESENQLLELAMKEILLALKWCDGQCSSLLIDCPSLERLCQLIEARFLSRKPSPGNTWPDNGDNDGDSPDDEDGNLFQLVVLKSELDLLRGQNEQLRVDVKSQRREYHELLRSNANNESAAPSPMPRHHHRQIEASCQTDIDRMEIAEVTGSGVADQVEERKVSCQNCARWSELTGHLSQCIVRIETKVNVSDESYISQMVGLHQLMRVLEKDLSARETLLAGSRRECHLLSQQKLLLEARLQFVESQLNSHLASCPLIAHKSNGTNTKVYTATHRDGQGGHIQSLTIQQSQQGQQHQQPRLMRSAQMTIGLLKSIINCLQARLDFKDERLQQLESLISTSHHQHQPTQEVTKCDTDNNRNNN